MDEGDKHQAIKLMCQAALCNTKLESRVTLFYELGLLLKELGANDAARAHLSLSSLLRQEQGWFIPDLIADTLREINRLIGDENSPKTVKEALSLCRKEWEKFAGITNSPHQAKRKPRSGLKGTVNLGNPGQPFCFIMNENKEPFFCFKSDLPEGIKNGAKVNFDALPSFDKKKNKESWKAVTISRSE